ncbi:DUF6545 domain-containing protein [Lentzea jiangxiensis]|uniref:DUF6545 domain-containing protein n=1 Tax=Lentzea jiangxiensis TaxID=641025 RepID=A0A1H0WTP8_9PSEU|nr:DUF6545 domain-containing protein [Lentzea jiangxiensis]SDP93970.1 hypothetical protein SAMN05421507_1234 [Lentzea jiangxiensis]
MWFVLVTGFGMLWSALALFAHLRRVKRRPNDPALPAKRSLLGAAVLATVSYALALPPFTTLLHIDGMWLNWPLIMVLGNCTVICVHMFYLFSVEERATAVRIARRGWLIYAVLTAVVIILFAMNPTASDYDITSAGRYQAGGPGNPFASVAYILSMGFSGAMNLVVCRLGWRWVEKSKGTRWLAMGLNTNALGQIGGFLMVLHSVSYNIALLFSAVPSWTQNSVETPVKGIAGLLTMLGLSATALSLWIKNSRLVVWAHANQARRRLYPLHRQMYDVFPVIAVEPPPNTALKDFLRMRRAKRQVLDRIVELWEGRQRLRVPRGTRALARELGSAEGLTGPALDAVVERACLEVGFEVARSGTTVRVEVATADEASRLVRDKGIAAELRWWEEVHHARNSPIVAQVRARTPELIRASTTSGSVTS